MLLPLFASGVLIVMLGDLRFALFALLSPVLAIGTHLEQRRRRKRLTANETQRFDTELRAFSHRLAQAAMTESARRYVAVPDPAESIQRAYLGSTALWHRRPGDPDFLRPHVGVATLPWQPSLDHVPGAPIDGRVSALIDQAVLTDTALAADLSAAGVIGIVGDRDDAVAVARSLLVQAAVHCGPADLSVSVSCDPGEEALWNWASWLPHTGVRRSPGERRWLSSGAAAGESMLREIAERSSADLAPVHLAVVDSAELLQGQRAVVRTLLGRGRERQPTHPGQSTFGERSGGATSPLVSGIVVAADEAELPAGCTTIIRVLETGRASVVTPETGERIDGVTLGRVGCATAERAARALARFSDPEVSAAHTGLPREVRLPDLFGQAGVSSEAIRRRWADASGLRVPVGIADGRIACIDLVADGPHGLVGGTTGSGKSEFLRTLVAGLAATHDPTRLSFILIDFKGGAAFAACARLPHTIGTITNLEAGLASRAVRALEAELGRRQRLFAAVGNGVDSLPAYLATSPTEPLPRIVLVIDEFAMLAQEHPEILSSLVSIAAVGRTLGVHLILATQRPAGVVTEDILTNTNLRIALRVQSREDSTSVIGTPDAAEISRADPGRALFRCGADDLRHVQTALATGSAPWATPVPVVAHDLDAWGIPVVTQTKKEDAGQRDTPDDLERLIAAIRKAHREAGYGTPRRVWPPPLDSRVALETIHMIPRDAERGTDTTAWVALADEPDRQRQVVAGWNLAAGNLLLVGIPGSGTSTALRSIAVALAGEHSPAELEILCLELGSQELTGLGVLPHTSAVVGEQPGDGERRSRMLRFFILEVRRRQRHPAAQRRLVILIDGFAALRDELQDPDKLELWDGFLRAYADGPQVGVHFAVATSGARTIPAVLEDTTTQRWIFRLPDPGAYTALGIRGPGTPSPVPGRCVEIERGRHLHIGVPAEPLPALLQRIRRRWPAHPVPADPVGILPGRVSGSRLAHLVDLSGEPVRVPVGVREDTLQPAALELHEGEHALITGPPRSGRSSLLIAIAAVLRSAAPNSSAGQPASGSGAGVTSVWGVAPRRSPLLAAPLHGVASTPEGIRSLLTGLMRRPDRATDRAFLLVDDVDRLHESDDDFDRFLQTAVPRTHVVVAGSPEELRGRYGHWTARARSARIGVLLQPEVDIDGELLGVRLPRRAPVAMTRGRGYLCANGSSVLIQAMSDAEPGGAEGGNDRAVR